MKANIHPEYKEITVTCSCGHTFVTGSALGKDLHIEVCNECHPFYTGKQKILDTAGRVEKFKNKFGLSAAKRAENQEGSSASEAKPQASSKPEAKPSAKPAAAKSASKAESAKSKGEKKSK